MHEPLGSGYLHRVAVDGRQFTEVQDVSYIHLGHVTGLLAVRDVERRPIPLVGARVVNSICPSIVW
jgi:hypothetical protein